MTARQVWRPLSHQQSVPSCLRGDTCVAADITTGVFTPARVKSVLCATWHTCTPICQAPGVKVGVNTDAASHAYCWTSQVQKYDPSSALYCKCTSALANAGVKVGIDTARRLSKPLHASRLRKCGLDSLSFIAPAHCTAPYCYTRITLLCALCCTSPSRLNAGVKVGIDTARRLSKPLMGGATDGTPLRADNYRELVALATELGIKRTQV